MVRTLIVAVTLLALSTDVQADLIVSVDFNEIIFGPTTAYSGAAVLGAAGDTWKGVGKAFNDTSPVLNHPLVDSTGATTSLTLSAPSLAFFDVGTNTTGPLYSGSAYELMRDYVYAPASAPQTLTVSGLTAGADYRLVVYSSTNVAGRETNFTVNGVTKTVSPIATSNLIEFVNYADFTTAADGSGQLSFTFTGNGSESALNGFQIQSVAAVPEPSSLVMFSLFGLCGAGLRRRRQCHATISQ
ncbi:MAG: PEP-CTERM sorting domain-containing protein [Planctomycetales bacterium]|nr:PEP-CTERM sorting domain-containing protein [Planctomycetales bacterium]